MSIRLVLRLSILQLGEGERHEDIFEVGCPGVVC